MTDLESHRPQRRTGPRRPVMLCVGAVLLVIAALTTGCTAGGGDDADQQRLVEERVSRERADAATTARQEQRVKELERQVRAASRERKKRSTAKAPATAPSTSSIQSPVNGQGDAPPTFHTGISGGEASPAAYCRFDQPSAGGGVYCWTPNDGYTLRLDASGVRRLRGDEAGNRGATPANYTELPMGSSRSVNGYRCASGGSGLTCAGPNGSGWVLPRYRGLPQLF